MSVPLCGSQCSQDLPSIHGLKRCNGTCGDETCQTFMGVLLQKCSVISMMAMSLGMPPQGLSQSCLITTPFKVGVNFTVMKYTVLN